MSMWGGGGRKERIREGEVVRVLAGAVSYIVHCIVKGKGVYGQG